MDSIGIKFQQDDASQGYLVAQSALNIHCLKAAMALNYDPDDDSDSRIKKQECTKETHVMNF